MTNITLISLINNYYKLIEKTTNQLKRMKRYKRQFIHKYNNMANKTMKKYATLVAIKQLQLK